MEDDRVALTYAQEHAAANGAVAVVVAATDAEQPIDAAAAVASLRIVPPVSATGTFVAAAASA